MTQQLDAEAPAESPRSLGSVIVGNWPYLLMLILALVGVALSSISPGRMIGYWEVLAPAFGVICFFARGADEFGGSGLRALRQEGLHWLAVLLSMRLIMIPEIAQMLNADSLGLMLLTILALGTFLAGNQIGSWKIGLTGVLLMLGVPAVAWLQRTVVLAALVAIAVVAVALFIKTKRN